MDLQENEPKYYPDARAWHSAHKIDDCVFFFGGMSILNMECTNEIVYYNFMQNLWGRHEVSESACPERMSHVGVTYENCILILGGYNENLNCTTDGQHSHGPDFEEVDMFSDNYSTNSTRTKLAPVYPNNFFKEIKRSQSTSL
jgi:hypothetical protein